jgi:hypothetical protein
MLSMKIRSLSLVLVLAVVAGGAMAGEAVHAATGNAAAIPANPAHQALGLSSADALTDVDVARLARAAVDMPACSTCH